MNSTSAGLALAARLSLSLCRSGWRQFAAVALGSAVSLLVGNQHVTAQQAERPSQFWPEGVSWDAAISTPRQYFGFDIGQRHLRHDQVVDYLGQLAEASPRITLAQYGRTHGGRPLLLLTITAAENHARLEEIRQAHRQLCSPGQAPSVALDNLPAVINMGYSVHGDEASAGNAAPLMAYYLAAAQGEQIERQLRHCVILLDPCLNPDGFDRFARWVNDFRGKIPNPDPQHAEHNQNWPPGRVNYYWFDLNRDWLPVQHPESQGRMNWYHRWKPNVVLDFHEMGSNSTYFFQPGVPTRANPLTPERNQELTARFGAYHARALDQIGSLYFTEEVFDDFYFGKGSTYPDLHGGVGILFEQGSSRGQVQENPYGLVRFEDAIGNQFATSRSSLEATVDLREELLHYQSDFYLQSRDAAATQPVRTIVFTAPGNRARLQSLARVLLHHDLRCYWLKEDLDYGDQTFNRRDTLVVPTDQPEYRFLQALLQRQTDFQENIFYDISAWTLPLAFGVEQQDLQRVIEAEKLEAAQLRGDTDPVAAVPSPGDVVAYLLDWRDDQAVGLAHRLLSADVVITVAREPFAAHTTAGLVEFPAGTICVPLGVQRGRTARIVQVLTAGARRGVPIAGVTSGLTPQGIDLGSNNFPVVQPPHVGLVIGQGVSAYQAGEIWHLFDSRVGMPLSLLDTSDLARMDLQRYTTLIMVSGSYELDPQTWQSMDGWLQRGGNLIAIGSAVDAVGKNILDRSLTVEDDRGSQVPPESDAEAAGRLEDRPSFAGASDDRALQMISGAIFETQVDLTHPLLFGFAHDRMPVFRNSTKVLVPAVPEHFNPVRYTDTPLLAGYCSSENLERIKGSTALAVHSRGGGRIIAMVDDPGFRAFWYGTSRLVFNGVFLGPLSTARGRGDDQHD